MIFPGKSQCQVCPLLRHHRVTQNISCGFMQAEETKIASFCWLSV